MEIVGILFSVTGIVLHDCLIVGIPMFIIGVLFARVGTSIGNKIAIAQVGTPTLRAEFIKRDLASLFGCDIAKLDGPSDPTEPPVPKGK